MILLYNICIRLYHGIIFLIQWFNPKAKQFVEGRQNSFNLVQEYASQQHSITYWFHCASLGEFEQARPLMEYLKRNDPEIRIALSFFSPSGYEHQKNYAYAEIVFYLPADSRDNAQELLKLLKPSKVFFIKYEFWLHYINESFKAGIPIYLVSALFRKDQVFFKWYGTLFREALKKYTGIFVQDQASEILLKDRGIASIVSGDTRYDRVLENKTKSQQDILIEEFIRGNKVIVAGSSWPQEEDIILGACEPGAGYKLIIAPHDIRRKIHIPQGMKSVEYTNASPGTVSGYDILILNTMGKLSSVYQYADIAFVGGGFRGGLHNILEAAVFGLPVIYGPQIQKHPEAEALQESGGGIIIHNKEEWKRQIGTLFNDPELLATRGKMAEVFINSNAGATLRIVKALQN